MATGGLRQMAWLLSSAKTEGQSTERVNQSRNTDNMFSRDRNREPQCSHGGSGILIDFELGTTVISNVVDAIALSEALSIHPSCIPAVRVLA
jgi:hypothetical protein